jgi:molybdenum cofactor biosynthesis enzyme MoaA
MNKSSEKKICPFPFSRIELGHRHENFVPCCLAWFDDSYVDDFGTREAKRTTDHKKYEKQWNSKQAIALRESILDGSYKYCNLDRCKKPQMTIQEIQDMDENYFETPISSDNIKEIIKGNSHMVSGPASISLAGDFKCNLECPTCRNSLKVTSNEAEQSAIDSEFAFVKQVKSSIKVIKLANSGEVFFSKDQRAFLKTINHFDFPNMNYVFVITNGLMLDQKNYDLLSPGTSFIKKISISMDAGDEKTYAKTRGGNWDKLLTNLAWIGKKRQKGEVLSLGYNFVVRKENYKSIDDFIKIGRKNHVDRFEFTKYDNWENYYETEIDLSNNYEDEAVHLKEHPEFNSLVKILEKYKNDKDISINIDGLFND